MKVRAVGGEIEPARIGRLAIVAHEIGEDVGERGHQAHRLGARGAAISEHERVDAEHLLVDRRLHVNRIVLSGADAAVMQKREPARDHVGVREAGDLKAALANGDVDEGRVLVDDEGGEIEIALRREIDSARSSCDSRARRRARRNRATRRLGAPRAPYRCRAGRCRCEGRRARRSRSLCRRLCRAEERLFLCEPADELDLSSSPACGSPACASANATSHDEDAAASRATFSTDPSVATLAMTPPPPRRRGRELVGDRVIAALLGSREHATP